ncbi:MAG TPA: type II secretion system secretin GspD [Steroidobacteraceae bacterium]
MIASCAAAKKDQKPRERAAQVTASQAAAEQPATPPSREPVIVQGTGQLVGTPNAQRTTPPPAAGDGYQLTFVDTEISSVVASVIGDGLGLPYSVDPQVKGTMTLQAARPLSREEVLPALEAALNVYGAALINVGGTYQVVPMKDAPRRVGGLRGPGQGSGVGFGVQIVPLRYVSAAEMEKALRPFAPDGGILRVDEGRNVLLLAGSSRELTVMKDVVATFDVDWLAGMSFALYPVEYVDAKTIADELSQVFADPRSPIGSVVRLVPLSRLNSLMVVTQEAGYLKEVEAWIKRLDIGATTPGRRIYVYDVQNGKADDLAESLSRILSISFERSQTTTDSQVRSYGRTGGGGGSGSIGSGFRSAMTESRSTVEEAPQRSPPTQVGDGSNGEPGALKIVPNTDNNALLIYATPSEFSVIETALRRLDVTPIQVLIEASLAEVSLTDDLRYGLQWAFQGGDGPLVLSEASNGAISPKFPGFSYLFTGRTDIRAVLNALESVTNVNVISSPKLLVLNNREAELQIGDQVPIIVQSAVSTVDQTSPIVNSVQLRDTGVILRITPRVNRSGLVLLDVAQEISDVVPTTTSNIDSPTIQQRRISSSIAVRNGETIALGGLIRDSKSRTRAGLPIASKIPLIGGLFGSTSNNNRRTELIVLITPRVVRSQQESDDLMDELHEQFRGLQKALPEWGGGGSSPPSSVSAPTGTK